MELKADTAYKLIKNKIILGQLKPMTDVSEEALQTELGFSRTPIREAMLRLKNDGYLRMYPNKGTFVSSISRAMVDSIYDMRRLNEPYICCKAAEYMPKDELYEIKEELSNPKEREANNRSYFITLDSDLHMKLLHFCRNHFLIQTMTNVYDHNERIRHLASNPIEDHSIEEHLDIVDAVLSKDEKAITAAVLKHIEASKAITTHCLLETNFNL